MRSLQVLTYQIKPTRDSNSSVGKGSFCAINDLLTLSGGRNVSEMSDFG